MNSAIMNCHEIQIEPRLQRLLPPLSEAELAGLESDILKNGVLSPIIVWNSLIVDGHHRYAICQKYGLPFEVKEMAFDSVDTAMLWAWQHQESRRNLTPFQRAEIALKFKPIIAEKARKNLIASGGDRKSVKAKSGSTNSPNPIETIDTRAEIAQLANIAPNTISRVEFLQNNADDTTKQKLRQGETTINAEYKRLKKEAHRKDREIQKQAEIMIALEDRVQLVTAGIDQAAHDVEADSVDFIVTDPPYSREYLELFDDLAKFAQHALKSGGSLLCMVGQSYLPEVLEKLSRTLQYRWTLAYLTPGGQATQLWERKVNTFWKPVLWFTKGNYDGDWIGDVATSKANDNDKNHHHWGQSESGMFDLMDRFLLPNMTVCDPCLGGGTTGICALALKCRFIGLDIDDDCVGKSRMRINQFLTGDGYEK